MSEYCSIAVEQKPSIGKLDPSQTDPQSRESLFKGAAAPKSPVAPSVQPSPFSAASMRAPPVLGNTNPSESRPASNLNSQTKTSSRQRASIIPDRDQFKIDEAVEDDHEEPGGGDERCAVCLPSRFCML